MPMENQNYIMREITPLSERDCFYIADRRKTEFTYPIHCHAEYELNFTEHASAYAVWWAILPRLSVIMTWC